MDLIKGQQARRVRRPADEILMEWGAYVRTFRQAQGALQRVTLGEGIDGARLPRSPGTHSDPVFANLAAEETLQIRRISSFDSMMTSYPYLWRRIAWHLYVNSGDMEQLGNELALSPRDTKGALALLKRQAEMDWAHTKYIETRARAAAAKAS